MKVLGIDSGFSRRESIGWVIINFSANGVELDYGNARLEDFLRETIPRLVGEHPDIAAVAIDSPLTESFFETNPSCYPTKSCRPQEHLFMQRPFQEVRIVPGQWMSRIGRGLYKAGMEILAALRTAEPRFSFAGWENAPPESKPVFEAFPKAWMGMLAPDELLLALVEVGTKRSDFDRFLYRDLLRTPELFSKWGAVSLGLDAATNRELYDELKDVTDGHVRAAATAALCAAEGLKGTGVRVGNPYTGHFMLPAKSTWSPGMARRFDEGVRTIAAKYSGLGQKGLMF